MSQFSADTIMPLITALPVEEQYAVRQKLNRMLGNSPAPKKQKKDIYDIVGEEYRPENKEILVGKILRGEI